MIKIGLKREDAIAQAKTFLNEKYSRVLIESILVHKVEDEKYISVNLVRDGVELIYNESGGNDIEENSAGVKKVIISREDFLNQKIPTFDFVSESVLSKIVTFQKKYFASFLEINPFVLDKTGELVCVDLAVELDSAKLHTLPKWVMSHVQNTQRGNVAETVVKELDSESTATFSLTVFDKDASVFTLLSGGGASLVVLDEMVNNGKQSAVANYGEYSGAPTTEETYRYTRELLELMFKSESSQKVLLVAGGVANFTDVTTTFQGVIDACAEYLEHFKQQPVLVMVRRGGPRQSVGLSLLEEFFIKNSIQATVSDPSISISDAVSNVVKYLK